ncbi:hypothetical protein LA66_16860 [Aureimonas altamirensis]|uniref:Uncharacterized protein n=1 Tax=Aureimonas altamirensis TaxID=370622 RepID=A0A0B1PZU4_9HYPH|nr:hypothetical protein LA66_16860 [Aureimonas altamirensis]
MTDVDRLETIWSEILKSMGNARGSKHNFSRHRIKHRLAHAEARPAFDHDGCPVVRTNMERRACTRLICAVGPIGDRTVELDTGDRSQPWTYSRRVEQRGLRCRTTTLAGSMTEFRTNSTILVLRATGQ